ncbi:motility protein A [Magnetospirillum sp. UT-4]|uniref:motility protein A n=1 Tax=Magnetospirillum sp. UT-4 TaxID=2681467 RepID=UPI00138347F1|nr:MotA/TolQ/ExbB proton channel family protein [Magnetospirillum sp. UT-4]CAA7615246.1 putative flagellar motor component [Magnetospirillum sp. UT-4]
MSLATIVGFLAGILLFLGSIALATDNYLVFLDGPSFIMVVGGTFASTFISYEPRYVLQAFKLMASIFFAPKVQRGILQGEVGRCIRWGYLIQKSGMAGLESDAGKVKSQDRFLGFGVDLVIAGYSGAEVRQILTNSIETTFQRSCIPADILRNMAGTAPAFGMIGTLIGLIIMLGQMGSDPAALGPGMAVALITTLYGVLFPRLVLLPAASKIQQREEIVRFRNYLVCEGLSLLAERKNPRFIQDAMNSFLDPAIHFDIDKMKGK